MKILYLVLFVGVSLDCGYASDDPIVSPSIENGRNSQKRMGKPPEVSHDSHTVKRLEMNAHRPSGTRKGRANPGLTGNVLGFKNTRAPTSVHPLLQKSQGNKLRIKELQGGHYMFRNGVIEYVTLPATPATISSGSGTRDPTASVSDVDSDFLVTTDKTTDITSRTMFNTSSNLAIGNITVTDVIADAIAGLLSNVTPDLQSHVAAFWDTDAAKLQSATSTEAVNFNTVTESLPTIGGSSGTSFSIVDEDLNADTTTRASTGSSDMALMTIQKNTTSNEHLTHISTHVPTWNESYVFSSPQDITHSTQSSVTTTEKNDHSLTQSWSALEEGLYVKTTTRRPLTHYTSKTPTFSWQVGSGGTTENHLGGLDDAYPTPTTERPILSSHATTKTSIAPLEDNLDVEMTSTESSGSTLVTIQLNTTGDVSLTQISTHAPTWNESNDFSSPQKTTHSTQSSVTTAETNGHPLTHSWSALEEGLYVKTTTRRPLTHYTSKAPTSPWQIGLEGTTENQLGGWDDAYPTPTSERPILSSHSTTKASISSLEDNLYVETTTRPPATRPLELTLATLGDTNSNGGSTWTELESGLYIKTSTRRPFTYPTTKHTATTTETLGTRPNLLINNGENSTTELYTQTSTTNTSLPHILFINETSQSYTSVKPTENPEETTDEQWSKLDDGIYIVTSTRKPFTHHSTTQVPTTSQNSYFENTADPISEAKPSPALPVLDSLAEGLLNHLTNLLTTYENPVTPKPGTTTMSTDSAEKTTLELTTVSVPTETPAPWMLPDNPLYIRTTTRRPFPWSLKYPNNNPSSVNTDISTQSTLSNDKQTTIEIMPDTTNAFESISFNNQRPSLNKPLLPLIVKETTVSIGESTLSTATSTTVRSPSPNLFDPWEDLFDPLYIRTTTRPPLRLPPVKTSTEMSTGRTSETTETQKETTTGIIPVTPNNNKVTNLHTYSETITQETYTKPAEDEHNDVSATEDKASTFSVPDKYTNLLPLAPLGHLWSTTPIAIDRIDIKENMFSKSPELSIAMPENDQVIDFSEPTVIPLVADHTVPHTIIEIKNDDSTVQGQLALETNSSQESEQSIGQQSHTESSRNSTEKPILAIPAKNPGSQSITYQYGSIISDSSDKAQLPESISHHGMEHMEVTSPYPVIYWSFYPKQMLQTTISPATTSVSSTESRRYEELLKSTTDSALTHADTWSNIFTTLRPSTESSEVNPPEPFSGLFDLHHIVNDVLNSYGKPSEESKRDGISSWHRPRPQRPQLGTHTSVVKDPLDRPPHQVHELPKRSPSPSFGLTPLPSIFSKQVTKPNSNHLPAIYYDNTHDIFPWRNTRPANSDHDMNMHFQNNTPYLFENSLHNNYNRPFWNHSHTSSTTSDTEVTTQEDISTSIENHKEELDDDKNDDNISEDVINKPVTVDNNPSPVKLIENLLIEAAKHILPKNTTEMGVLHYLIDILKKKTNGIETKNSVKVPVIPEEAVISISPHTTAVKPLYPGVDIQTKEPLLQSGSPELPVTITHTVTRYYEQEKQDSSFTISPQNIQVNIRPDITVSKIPELESSENQKTISNRITTYSSSLTAGTIKAQPSVTYLPGSLDSTGVLPLETWYHIQESSFVPYPSVAKTPNIMLGDIRPTAIFSNFETASYYSDNINDGNKMNIFSNIITTQAENTVDTLTYFYLKSKYSNGIPLSAVQTASPETDLHNIDIRPTLTTDVNTNTESQLHPDDNFIIGAELFEPVKKWPYQQTIKQNNVAPNEHINIFPSKVNVNIHSDQLTSKFNDEIPKPNKINNKEPAHIFPVFTKVQPSGSTGFSQTGIKVQPVHENVQIHPQDLLDFHTQSDQDFNIRPGQASVNIHPVQTNFQILPDQGNVNIRPNQASSSIWTQPANVNVRPASVNIRPDQVIVTIQNDQDNFDILPDKASISIRPNENINRKPDQAYFNIQSAQGNANIRPEETNVNTQPAQESVIIRPDQATVNIRPNQENANIWLAQNSIKMRPDQPDINIQPDQVNFNILPDQTIVDIQPGEAYVNIQPNQANDNIWPDQANANIQPDHTTVNIGPSQASANVRPGQAFIDVQQDQDNFNTQPNQHLVDVRPSEAYVNIRPGQTNVNIRPDQANVNIRPDQANVNIRPDQANFIRRPAQANVNIQPDHANFNIRPNQANVNVQPDHTNVNIRPNQANVNIQPDLTNVNIRPNQANVNIQLDLTNVNIRPNQANVNIKPDNTNVNIRPNQANGNIRPGQANLNVFANLQSDQASVNLRPVESNVNIQPHQLNNQASDNLLPHQVNVNIQSDHPNKATFNIDHTSSYLPPAQFNANLRPDQATLHIIPDQTSYNIKPNHVTFNMQNDRVIAGTTKPSQSSISIHSNADNSGPLTNVGEDFFPSFGISPQETHINSHSPLPIFTSSEPTTTEDVLRPTIDILLRPDWMTWDNSPMENYPNVPTGGVSGEPQHSVPANTPSEHSTPSEPLFPDRPSSLAWIQQQLSQVPVNVKPVPAPGNLLNLPSWLLGILKYYAASNAVNANGIANPHIPDVGIEIPSNFLDKLSTQLTLLNDFPPSRPAFMSLLLGPENPLHVILKVILRFTGGDITKALSIVSALNETQSIGGLKVPSEGASLEATKGTRPTEETNPITDKYPWNFVTWPPISSPLTVQDNLGFVTPLPLSETLQTFQSVIDNDEPTPVPDFEDNISFHDFPLDPIQVSAPLWQMNSTSETSNSQSIRDMEQDQLSGIIHKVLMDYMKGEDANNNTKENVHKLADHDDTNSFAEDNATQNSEGELTLSGQTVTGDKENKTSVNVMVEWADTMAAAILNNPTKYANVSISVPGNPSPEDVVELLRRTLRDVLPRNTSSDVIFPNPFILQEVLYQLTGDDQLTKPQELTTSSQLSFGDLFSDYDKVTLSTTFSISVNNSKNKNGQSHTHPISETSTVATDFFTVADLGPFAAPKPVFISHNTRDQSASHNQMDGYHPASQESGTFQNFPNQPSSVLTDPLIRPTSVNQIQQSVYHVTGVEDKPKRDGEALSNLAHTPGLPDTTYSNNDNTKTSHESLSSKIEPSSSQISTQSLKASSVIPFDETLQSGSDLSFYNSGGLFSSSLSPATTGTFSPQITREQEETTLLRPIYQQLLSSGTSEEANNVNIPVRATINRVNIKVTTPPPVSLYFEPSTSVDLQPVATYSQSNDVSTVYNTVTVTESPEVEVKTSPTSFPVTSFSTKSIEITTPHSSLDVTNVDIGTDLFGNGNSQALVSVKPAVPHTSTITSTYPSTGLSVVTELHNLSSQVLRLQELVFQVLNNTQMGDHTSITASGFPAVASQALSQVSTSGNLEGESQITSNDEKLGAHNNGKTTTLSPVIFAVAPIQEGRPQEYTETYEEEEVATVSSSKVKVPAVDHPPYSSYRPFLMPSVPISSTVLRNTTYLQSPFLIVPSNQNSPGQTDASETKPTHTNLPINSPFLVVTENPEDYNVTATPPYQPGAISWQEGNNNGVVSSLADQMSTVLGSLGLERPTGMTTLQPEDLTEKALKLLEEAIVVLREKYGLLEHQEMASKIKTMEKMQGLIASLINQKESVNHSPPVEDPQTASSFSNSYDTLNDSFISDDEVNHVLKEILKWAPVAEMGIKPQAQTNDNTNLSVIRPSTEPPPTPPSQLLASFPTPLAAVFIPFLSQIHNEANNTKPNQAQIQESLFSQLSSAEKPSTETLPVPSNSGENVVPPWKPTVPPTKRPQLTPVPVVPTPSIGDKLHLHNFPSFMYETNSSGSDTTTAVPNSELEVLNIFSDILTRPLTSVQGDAMKQPNKVTDPPAFPTPNKPENNVLVTSASSEAHPSLSFDNSGGTRIVVPLTARPDIYIQSQGEHNSSPSRNPVTKFPIKGSLHSAYPVLHTQGGSRPIPTDYNLPNNQLQNSGILKNEHQTGLINPIDPISRPTYPAVVSDYSDIPGYSFQGIPGSNPSNVPVTSHQSDLGSGQINIPGYNNPWRTSINHNGVPYIGYPNIPGFGYSDNSQSSQPGYNYPGYGYPDTLGGNYPINSLQALGSHLIYGAGILPSSNVRTPAFASVTQRPATTVGTSTFPPLQQQPSAGLRPTKSPAKDNGVYRCGDSGTARVSNFLNPSYPLPDRGRGICTFRLHILDPTVCQVRVDFVESAMLLPVQGDCKDQRLHVEGTIQTPSVNAFCGRNTDQHFYIDLLDAETPTSGGDAGGRGRRRWVDFVVTTTSSRFLYRFGLWVSQVACEGDSLRAPPGCLQYFRSPSGVIKSFNFEGRQYLNDYTYRICLRVTPGSCEVEFTTREGDFGIQKLNSRFVPYDRAGTGPRACARDYLYFPNLVTEGAADASATSSGNGGRICGGKFSYVHGDTVARPVNGRVSGEVYVLYFRSGRPRVFVSGAHGPGFKMTYQQKPVCSLPRSSSVLDLDPERLEPTPLIDEPLAYVRHSFNDLYYDDPYNDNPYGYLFGSRFSSRIGESDVADANETSHSFHNDQDEYDFSTTGYEAEESPESVVGSILSEALKETLPEMEATLGNLLRGEPHAKGEELEGGHVARMSDETHTPISRKVVVKKDGSTPYGDRFVVSSLVSKPRFNFPVLNQVPPSLPASTLRPRASKVSEVLEEAFQLPTTSKDSQTHSTDKDSYEEHTDEYSVTAHQTSKYSSHDNGSKQTDTNTHEEYNDRFPMATQHQSQHHSSHDNDEYEEFDTAPENGLNSSRVRDISNIDAEDEDPDESRSSLDLLIRAPSAIIEGAMAQLWGEASASDDTEEGEEMGMEGEEESVGSEKGVVGEEGVIVDEGFVAKEGEENGKNVGEEKEGEENREGEKMKPPLPTTRREVSSSVKSQTKPSTRLSSSSAEDQTGPDARPFPSPSDYPTRHPARRRPVVRRVDDSKTSDTFIISLLSPMSAPPSVEGRSDGIVRIPRRLKEAREGPSITRTSMTTSTTTTLSPRQAKFSDLVTWYPKTLLSENVPTGRPKPSFFSPTELYKHLLLLRRPSNSLAAKSPPPTDVTSRPYYVKPSRYVQKTDESHDSGVADPVKNHYRDSGWSNLVTWYPDQDMEEAEQEEAFSTWSSVTDSRQR